MADIIEDAGGLVAHPHGLSERTVQRLYLAADIIESEKFGFNMASYLQSDFPHECGTAGCIAGTIALFDNPAMVGTHVEDSEFPTHEFAAEWLGLTERQSNLLFLGVPGESDRRRPEWAWGLMNADRERVCQVLRGLASGELSFAL